MRIVRRKEFLDLPAHTLYSPFEPHHTQGLHVKLHTTVPYEEHGGDFLYQSIELSLDSPTGGDWADALFKAMEDSKLSLTMDFDCCGRDGLRENNQYYVVYEAKDLVGIIRLLQACLNAAES